MKKFSFTNFAVFVLFFGVAAVEAFQTKNWLKVGFWCAIGLVFLIADLRKTKNPNDQNLPGGRKSTLKKRQ
jgi:hypothetical protein